MQNDLISKKTVLDFIKEELKQDRPDDFKIRNIERFINDLPTAYDVEKVVAELEEQIDNNRGWEDEDYYWGETKGYEHAIEIVRNGGKE